MGKPPPLQPVLPGIMAAGAEGKVGGCAPPFPPLPRTSAAPQTQTQEGFTGRHLAEIDKILLHRWIAKLSFISFI